MTGTVEREFEVAEISDDYVWLEVMSGHNQGIQIAVPKSGDYDPKLQKRITQLEEKETIEATLVSVNDKNTAWKFKKISNESQDHHQIVADD